MAVAQAIGIGLGLLQGGIGIVQSISAKKKINKLLSERKAYQTPQEVFDILNATKNNVSSGYDPATLNYLTNQTDQAFSSGLGVLERLGGNPNDLSGLFQKKVDDIMKISGEDHQLRMEKFSSLLNAYSMVAENKAAEQKSVQDILKDKLQAAGVQAAAGTGNISGGLNTVTAALSAAQIANLYNPDGTLKVKKDVLQPIGSQTNAYGVAPRGTIF